MSRLVVGTQSYDGFEHDCGADAVILQTEILIMDSKSTKYIFAVTGLVVIIESKILRITNVTSSLLLKGTCVTGKEYLRLFDVPGKGRGILT